MASAARSTSASTSLAGTRKVSMPWPAAPIVTISIVLDLIGMVVGLAVDLDGETGIAQKKSSE